MPRVSREQTQLNRAAIEAASSRLFRECGIKSVSVADLMAAAGLTHGGFYGHFESKDTLVNIACTQAFTQSAQRWATRLAEAASAGAARAAVVEGYLSPRSRDGAGQSCPAATLATDVAREPAAAPVRASFLAGLEDLLALLAHLRADQPDAEARAGALADMATLVGALTLARAVQGHDLSDEILAAARQHLLGTPPT